MRRVTAGRPPGWAIRSRRRRGGPRRRRSGRRRGRRRRAPRGRACASRARPSASGMPKPSIAARRSASIVSCGKPAIRSASSSARSRCLPGSTTSLTRPIRCASSASTGRPVRISSSARPMPTTRGSRWVPPSISGTPQRRSKRPKVESRGGDPQVAPERQLDAAGEAPAVDRGDRRLRRGEPGRAHRPVRVVDVEVHRLQVGAGAEGLAAGAGEDEDAGARRRPRSRAAPGGTARPRRRRPRCGARAGRSSAPRRRRPARSEAPRSRRIRVAVIARHPVRAGAGGLVDGVPPGLAEDARSQGAPRRAARRAGAPQPAAKARDPVGRSRGTPRSGTKKRPGVTLVACLRVAFARRSSFAPPSRWCPTGLPRGLSLPVADANLARPLAGAQGVGRRDPANSGNWRRESGAQDQRLARDPRSYPARMRIDEILAARRADLLGRVLPAEDRGGDRAALRDRALAARAGARLRLGHLRRRRLDPRGDGRDHQGAEGRARLRDDGAPELRRRDHRGPRGDARPDRRGRDRERLRAARRPAARRGGLRPARGRARQRRRAGRVHLRPAGTSRSAAPASPRSTPRRPTSTPTSPT